MKKLALILITIFTLINCKNNLKTQKMDKNQIVETVNQLFIAVDDRNWEQVGKIFNDTVLLDYSSMSGGNPVQLTSAQIIDSWKGILPGFDKTHHQTGNFIVNIDSGTINVFCYGTATHYLKNESNNNVWTVVGSYNFELIEKSNNYVVTKMKFNLKYIEGNLDLPKLASEKIKN